MLTFDRELCESGGGRPELPVSDSPYGLCGRKATLDLNQAMSQIRFIFCCVVQSVFVL